MDVVGPRLDLFLDFSQDSLKRQKNVRLGLQSALTQIFEKKPKLVRDNNFESWLDIAIVIFLLLIVSYYEYFLIFICSPSIYNILSAILNW